MLNDINMVMLIREFELFLPKLMFEGTAVIEPMRVQQLIHFPPHQEQRQCFKLLFSFILPFIHAALENLLLCNLYM